MADLTPLGFDPAQQETVNAYTVIPPGLYTVMAVKSEVKDTKKSGGKILEMTYQIVNGPNAGDTIVDNLNIVNASATAQNIGLSQLKDLCEAVGHVGLLSDSNSLHGKPFTIQVTVEEFESNKEAGKMLKSSKVAKRMSLQNSSSSSAAASGGGTQQQSKSKW